MAELIEREAPHLRKALAETDHQQHQLTLPMVSTGELLGRAP